MFRLHDSTRRLICRTAFVLLCVVPTTATLGWCAYWNSSLPRLVLQQQMSRQLGLRTSAERATQPFPGVLLLEGVQLFHPETGQPIARMRLLQVTRTDTAWVLIASQPEVQAAQFGPLCETISDRLRDVPDSVGLVRLLAGELTVHWPNQSRTFSDVAATIDRQQTAAEIELQFRVAGLDMPEAARLRLHRNRETSPPTNRCELHTGKTPLPCGLLLSPLAVENRLGPDSRFRGSLWLQQSASGWQGTVVGELTDVNLRSLTERFSHLLTGTATITVQNAIIERGRIVEALGSLESRGGLVDRSLLLAARDQLAMHAPLDLSSALERLQYEQFALQFSIDATGLTLQGQCTGSESKAIFTWGGQPLLLQAGRDVPVVALVRTLVPNSEVAVPATQQTDWLNRLLPLPDVVPPEGQTPKGRLHQPASANH